MLAERFLPLITEQTNFPPRFFEQFFLKKHHKIDTYSCFLINWEKYTLNRKGS